VKFNKGAKIVNPQIKLSFQRKQTQKKLYAIAARIIKQEKELLKSCRVREKEYNYADVYSTLQHNLKELGEDGLDKIEKILTKLKNQQMDPCGIYHLTPEQLFSFAEILSLEYIAMLRKAQP
jgi:predicted GH43/DUF377 family glycosyl hydrolase